MSGAISASTDICLHAHSTRRAYEANARVNSHSPGDPRPPSTWYISTWYPGTWWIPGRPSPLSRDALAPPRAALARALSSQQQQGSNDPPDLISHARRGSSSNSGADAEVPPHTTEPTTVGRAFPCGCGRTDGASAVAAARLYSRRSRASLPRFPGTCIGG